MLMLAGVGLIALATRGCNGIKLKLEILLLDEIHTGSVDDHNLFRRPGGKHFSA